MPTRVSREDFIAACQQFRSPKKISEATGITVRQVAARRARYIAQGENIPPSGSRKGSGPAVRHTETFIKRRQWRLRNGTIIVFSDAHYWPGEPSKSHIALTRVAKELKPFGVIANGDILDGVRISRHEPRGWQSAPTLKQELDIVVERLDEVRDAAGHRCKFARTLGNHDIRFERWLATRAPEVEDLPGTRLEDYIPDWPCSWSLMVNEDCIIKHRWKGGKHATYRNTLESGLSIVTGHLHSMKCSPVTDLRSEIRFGIDAGCLADPDHDAFDYTEDNPTDWRSGFAVLTWRDGVLLWPEFCYQLDGSAWFRNERVA